jgi:putative oxidoreductase
MRSKDVGMLALRVGLGGALAAHGAQKLLGWFGGPGREGAAAGFQAMGFPRHQEAVVAASACELGGGLMLATGLATPAASAAVIGAMRTAADIHRPNGFFAQSGGYELAAAYGLAAGTIAFMGPGRLSLDHALGGKLAKPWMAVAGIAAGLVGGTLVARTRQTAPAAAADEVVDITAEERADDEVAMGLQTPFAAMSDT